jgi:hypothetical protein
VELIQELFLRVMAPRSKILLTSHSRIVVEQMNVFHLKGLSDEESLSLLMMLALPSIDRMIETGTTFQYSKC